VADQTSDVPTKLLWIDLEMTGLDPTRDRNLEVAVVVTDFDFTELGTYEAVIRQDPAELDALLKASAWHQAQPAYTQAMIDQNESGKPEADVERELCELTERLFQGEPAILAGNSIHQDRGFIKSWLPRFDRLLHYRMLDVTSFKIVYQAKYGIDFQKPIESHRAVDDIRESIDELRYYLDYSASR
jgi:oligoribonuclease